MLCVIGIDGSDVLIAVFDVERRSAGIDVLGDKVPAVVGQRAFAAHGGDGSLHGVSLFFPNGSSKLLFAISSIYYSKSGSFMPFASIGSMAASKIRWGGIVGIASRRTEKVIEKATL